MERSTLCSVAERLLAAQRKVGQTSAGLRLQGGCRLFHCLSFWLRFCCPKTSLLIDYTLPCLGAQVGTPLPACRMSANACGVTEKIFQKMFRQEGSYGINPNIGAPQAEHRQAALPRELLGAPDALLPVAGFRRFGQGGCRRLPGVRPGRAGAVSPSTASRPTRWRQASAALPTRRW